MSSQYSPKQIADFIVKHANNQEVKKELKKQGYNIVPNSLSKLINSLEKAGFSVTKKTEDQTNGNVVSGDKNKHMENQSIQILGAKQINQPEKEKETSILNNINKPKKESESGKEERKIINPFGEGFLDSKNINTVDNTPTAGIDSINQNSKVEEKNEGTKEFKHYSQPEKEPDNPQEKTWFQIKKDGKLNQSIGFYSLIVNAQLVKLEEDKIVLGFGTNHTYQINQLKKENNMMILEQLIARNIGKKINIELTVISKNKEENLTVEESKSESVGNKIIQVFGGRS